MAKTKFRLKFNFFYDSPVSQSFVIFTVFLFLLDIIFFKLKINSNFLLSPTAKSGVLPFAFGDIKTWFRLFLYVFGGTDKVLLFTNLLFIVLIGPSMEERYGSFIIGIMFLVSTFFTGVLNSCFCKNSLAGCSNVVFTLLILNALSYFKKQTVCATSVSMVLLFICREFFISNVNGVLGTIIILAGGLCGSLLAFLTSPKTNLPKKQEKGFLSKAEKISQIDKESPRNKKPTKSSLDDDSTVVGTLKF